MYTKKFLITLAAIFILTLAAVYLIPSKFSQTVVPTPTPQAVEQEEKLSVEQTINFNGAKENQIDTLEIKEGETVLDVLQKSKNAEIKDSSFGKFIEGIDGVKGGGSFWLYYVNDEQAQIGAGEYKLKGGEKIEWRFEKRQ